MGGAGERAVAHAIVHTKPASSPVLVSGANGFIGLALCRALTEAGVTMRRAVRRTTAAENQPKRATFEVGETSALADQPALHRRVNVAASRRLAEQAAEIRES